MMIHNRRAAMHHKHDGHHVVFHADVSAGELTVHYEAHHHAHELIDHERILSEFDAKMQHRAGIIGDVFSLHGQKDTIVGIPYEIIEANIQVHGPADFQLYVAWLEEHEGKKIRKNFKVRAAHPKDLPGKEAARARVRAHVASTATMLDLARLRVQNFHTDNPETA